jgi:hypothetical protein
VGSSPGRRRGRQAECGDQRSDEKLAARRLVLRAFRPDRAMDYDASLSWTIRARRFMIAG